MRHSARYAFLAIVLLVSGCSDFEIGRGDVQIEYQGGTNYYIEFHDCEFGDLGTLSCLVTSKFDGQVHSGQFGLIAYDDKGVKLGQHRINLEIAPRETAKEPLGFVGVKRLVITH